MKRFLWLIAVLCVCFPVYGADLKDRGGVDITSLQADFQQEKHMKMLVQPIISQGSFSFQAPSSLRWEYRSPVPSILLMHGESVRKYVEVDGAMQEVQGLPMSSMQIILTEITNWLDGRFTDNELFTVTQPDSDHILLTPKQGTLDGFIETIELHLEGNNGLLRAVTIHEGGENFTRMTFTNRVLNQKLPANLFTVQ